MPNLNIQSIGIVGAPLANSGYANQLDRAAKTRSEKRAKSSNGAIKGVQNTSADRHALKRAVSDDDEKAKHDNSTTDDSSAGQNPMRNGRGGIDTYA
jgi:hypothetical protein